MPFTIDGQWIPSKDESKATSKQLKVRLIKRGKSVLTVILNLNYSEKELQTLAANLKKKLGCGGAVKEDTIEIQGDKVEAVKKHLLGLNLKPV